MAEQRRCGERQPQQRIWLSPHAQAPNRIRPTLDGPTADPLDPQQLMVFNGRCSSQPTMAPTASSSGRPTEPPPAPVMATDISERSGFSPDELTIVAGTMFFTASDGTDGSQL
jgi:hypothetical protein